MCLRRMPASKSKMKINSIKFKILLTVGIASFFFFAFSVGQTFAATYYWSATSSTDVSVKSNWTTSSSAACGASPNTTNLLVGDTFNFSSTCTTNANIYNDWTVRYFNMNASYTGTITGSPGVKLRVYNLTQTSGTLNVSTVEFTKETGTSHSYNGGTRTIDTYLISGYGTNCSINVPLGQTLAVNNLNISGTNGTAGSVNMPALNTGNFTTGNLNYLTGTNTYIYSGVLNVTGNINTVSTAAGGVFTVNLIGTGTSTIDVNNAGFNIMNIVKDSNGAVVVGGSQPLAVANFTLTRGNFSGDKLISTNFLQTAGELSLNTFEHNRAGSTVTFNGGTTTIATFISSGVQTGTINVALGKTVSVTDFNITGAGGSIYLPAVSGVGRLYTEDLTYLSGSVSYIYSGAIYVTGNIDTVSTVVGTGAATINLVGTSTNQVLSINNLSKLCSTLKVDKDSGNVVLTGSQSLYVGVFTLTNGNVVGDKIIADSLTQDGGNLAVNILQHYRVHQTYTFNGGTRNGGTNIPTYLSLSGGGNSSFTIALGQTVSFDTFSISGAGGYITKSGSGNLDVRNVVHESGSTGYIRSGQINVSGNFTTVSTTPDTSTTLVLNLNGDGDQIISVGSSTSKLAATLIVNGASTTVTTSGQNLYVTNFTLTQGNFSSNQIKVSGVLTQTSGVLTLQTLENQAGGTAVFNGGARTINSYLVSGASPIGSGITVAAGQYLYLDDVQINNTTSQVSFTGSTAASLVINNLTRSSVNTSAFAGTFTVIGNISNLSTSNTWTWTGSGGLTLSTSTDQTITGDISFYRLTKQVTSPATLYFSASSTITVTNILTLSGASSVSRLSLRSTIPTVQWKINPTATPVGSYRILSYVDVKDSNNTNANSMGASSITGYVNSGNNTNWGDSGITVTYDPNRTWKGQTSNLWSVASNWWEGSVPGATDIAIFRSSGSTYPALYDPAVLVGPSSVQLISGYSGVVTLGKDLTITSSFTQSGGTFSTNGYSFVVDGSATISGGTFNSNNSENDFNSGLTLSGGILNVGSSTSNINATFSQSGGTFNGGSGTTTVSGNFSRTGGTFNGDTGLVSFTGGNQTISGTTTFANLSKIVSSAYTLTLPASKTTTITGTTTLKGTSGNLLSLRSSSAGTQWGFDPQGGRVFEYLDVKDSNNIADEINAADHIGLTDANGISSNTNWVFTIPVLTISATGTQAASTSIPIVGKYMGGPFVATSSVPANITSIKLTQVGSLPTSYISLVRIYYDTAVSGVCANSISGADYFGGSSSWVGDSVTITGTMAVGSDEMCIFPVFNLTGSFSPEIMYRSIDLEISDPSSDISAAGTDISPATAVNILGTTLVDGGNPGYPTISMSIANSSIGTGAWTSITWSTGNNASGCTASGDWSGSKDPAGDTESTGVLNEHRIYTYSLSCHNANGTSSSAVYVNVINPNAPVLTFTASPTQVTSGQSAGLEWSNRDGLNTPTSCIASGNWSGSQSFSGGHDTGPITSYKSYTLACGNSYGTTTKSVGVGVGTVVVPHCSNGIKDYDETAVDYGGSCGEGYASGSGADSYGDRVTIRMPGDYEVLFYFHNDGRHNALYMRDDSNASTRKLTADNLNIVDGSFDEIGCVANECSGLRVQMVIEKLSNNGSIQNYQIEKTFKTTVKSKKNQ